MEDLKIYLRSEDKIYIFYENEINFYEKQDLMTILENFFEEKEFNKVEFKKNIKVSFILHFSYFKFENFGIKKIEEIKNKNDEKENDNLKKTLKIGDFICKEMIFDYLNDKKLDIYLSKSKILEIKKIVKKYFLGISEIKIDFQAIYNFLKNKNKDKNLNFEVENNKNLKIENLENKSLENEKVENKVEIINLDVGVEETITKETVEKNLENKNFEKEKIEIFQIGEEKSLRILVENEKILEIEKIDLNLSDIGLVSEYDFGEMEIFADSEEDIKIIFAGSELFESSNFAEKEKIFYFESLKDIKINDIAIILFLISGYFLLSNFLNNEKLEKENEKIKNETKILEKNYLRKKEEELPNYLKELKTLSEIDNSIGRDEFYSYIKFLVESSKNGVDYTKINYENSKWVVDGELMNFKNFEKFENRILKKYPNSELGYLKDKSEDEATIFEYILKN